MDRLTPNRRSWNMSRIRGRDTAPERRVRSLLHRRGFRFALRRQDLPGKPDIVLAKHRAVVLEKGQIRFAGSMEALMNDDAAQRSYLSV